MTKQPVIADVSSSTLTIPHIGVTLRVLLAAANNANPQQSHWGITYKNVNIGTVKIKTNATNV
jgi:broad specificity phosphatase PhoE